MEAAVSSEALVPTYQITRRQILEDNILHFLASSTHNSYE
jgi:tyrosine-protein phosphatase YwqE